MFTLAWKELHQSAQLDILYRSFNSICEQTRLDVGVYSWVRLLSMLSDFREEGTAWVPWLSRPVGLLHIQLELLSVLTGQVELSCVVRWGQRLDSAIICSWTGKQAMVPGNAAKLAGLCDWSVLQAVLCNHSWSDRASGYALHPDGATS